MEVANQVPLKPQTIGEELYLIHLRRHAGEEPKEEDFDHISPRKRLHDAGEELWEVHLKRSRGMEPDLDLEVTTPPPCKPKSSKATAKQENSPPKACRYNLRSKDAKKKPQ